MKNSSGWLQVSIQFTAFYESNSFRARFFSLWKSFHGVGGPSGKPAGRLSFVEKADGGGKRPPDLSVSSWVWREEEAGGGVDTQVGTARCLEGICFLFSPCSLTHSREQAFIKSLLANGQTNYFI